MNRQLLFKLVIDFIMTSLMLIAFAYQLTGNLAHEVIGIILLLLFITHNLLNGKWYKNLFKGKYGSRRTLGTIINGLLVISMMMLTISGIMISRDIFSFGGGFEARRIHMMSAHLLLILSSIHLGMHWSMIMGVMRKMMGLTGTSRTRSVVLCVLSIVIAIYGVKSSFNMSVGSKLFMQHTFGFWDFENAAAGFFLAYLSIMGLYTAFTYYTLKLLRKPFCEEK